ADLAVRLLPLQVELKIGVLTALIGAPFFFYLIARQRNTADAN
ncbi:MAG TPA: ABC transporter permease, partial [Gammaproteobacteria bacterium]|nr:ABC transporter permease [Gammaproteobacteria bacterium]